MNESGADLWPTRIRIYSWPETDLDIRLKSLVETLHAKQLEVTTPISDDRHRCYGVFEQDGPAIDELKRRILQAVARYLATDEPISPTITGRAVVMRKGDYILTHTESREADLTVAYWPTGDGQGTPTFYVQDPSRHMTELRLPNEERHTVHIHPKAGEMLVAPAHLPHGMLPYQGDDTHIQIVCNIRLNFSDDYFRRKW